MLRPRALFFRRPFGGRHGLEALVRDRGATLDRQAICAGCQTLLSTLECIEPVPEFVGQAFDGKYLYLTNPTLMPSPDTSHIDEFRIGAGGSLTMIGSTAQGMAVGISGAGAH